MHSCPFCQSPISEDLALQGGHCPSCLIEIPGEESATDPGMAAEAVAPEAVATGGVPVRLIAAVAIIGLGVAGVAVTSGSPDDGAEPVAVQAATPIPLSAHEDQPLPEAVEASAPSSERSTARRARRTVTKQVKSGSATPALASAVAKDASVVPSGGASGLGSAPRDVFSTIGAAPRSREQQSIVLNDALQIEEMVGRVLNRGAKQMEQCYNQALKTQEGLKGAWYVDFTITPAGKPFAVSVEAMDAPHAGMEACIKRQVARWRFQRVSQHVDVARTYRFGS